MDFKKKKRYRENTPISNNNNKNAMELYGFYYDKEKNRYFPINQDLQSNFFKKENKKETKPIKSNWIKTIYSTYSLISRYSKIISNKALYSSFPISKERIKQYNISSLGDKVSNLPYAIMDKRYIVTMSNSSSMSVLTFTKISTDSYIKKMFFDNNNSTKYDNFTITEDNTLIIINNFTLHFIFQPSILNWLDNIKQNINFLLSSSIKLQIQKANQIPMMYTWPIISQKEDKYYILIWKAFYIISIDKVTKVKKKNTETIIIDKFCNDTEGFNVLYKKNYTKESFINLFVNDKTLLLFEAKGNIYKYSLRSMKLKQIISNESVSSIVDIVRYNREMLFFICVDRSMFSYKIKNNAITMLYKSGSKNNLIFKRNLITIDGDLVFFKNENNKICAYSLREYEIMKEYNIKDNEYNYIYRNNNIVLLL